MNDFTPDYAAEIPQTPFAKTLETHVSQDYINRLTQIFWDIEAGEWLQEYPLSQLEVTHNILNDGVSVNGMYYYTREFIQIATIRPREHYGQPFQWERVYSISSTAEIQFESVQMTLIHEFGHHIHNILGKQNREQFMETMSTNFMRGGTTYAKRNHLEYFAESFALYIYYPTELLVKDPDGYGMIERALAQVRLEVRQQ
jgi:hypothetical protein